MNKKQPDYNVILCRYSEIALKGKNRWRFEQKMIDRINRLLNKFSYLKVKKIRGRIVIHYIDYAVFTCEENEIISKALTRVFGLDSFSFSIRTESKIDSIRNTVNSNSNSIIDNKIKIKKNRRSNLSNKSKT